MNEYEPPNTEPNWPSEKLNFLDIVTLNSKKKNKNKKGTGLDYGAGSSVPLWLQLISGNYVCEAISS